MDDRIFIIQATEPGILCTRDMVSLGVSLMIKEFYKGSSMEYEVGLKIEEMVRNLRESSEANPEWSFRDLCVIASQIGRYWWTVSEGL